MSSLLGASEYTKTQIARASACSASSLMAALKLLLPPPFSRDANQPPPLASWALIQLAKVPTSCQGHL